MALPWYHARAGGRRRYNKARQVAAAARRRLVVGLLARGLSQAEIARRVGVHRATVCRDAAWLGKLPGLVAGLAELPAGRVKVTVTRRGWAFKYAYG